MKTSALDEEKLEPAHPVRTVEEMIRALRFGSAKQQHLFCKDRKEKFLWEESLLGN